MKQVKQSVIVNRANFKGGTLEVPGDKSISHRVAILAAMASGESKVRNFLTCEDCVNTLHAMEALGARTFFSESGELSIRGTAGRLIQPAGQLDCGNSGTAMRLLAGVISGLPMTIELTGDASLSARPMGRIKDPLEKMGAKIELLGPNGCAPIRIQGGGVKGITYPLPVASAQVKSCILLATLFADGTSVVTEPRPTRDHTERLLRTLGVPVKVKGLCITLEGFGSKGPEWPARSWNIPGDFSSAAYWMVAVAGREGATVTIKNAGLNPRRTALLNVLKRMGAEVDIKPNPQDEAEPAGDITVKGGRLKATEVSGDEIPNLIDELPLVAVLGALAEGRTVIRDAAELRVKESDRIATMAANLRLLGADVEEQKDGMAVLGPAKLKATSSVKSYGDHRIAMSMAVLALYMDEPVCINNIACVETSYPTFWEHLESMGARAE